MTQDELNKVTQDVIAELKKNGTNIADASVVSDISQVNNLVAYGKNGKVIKVTPRTIQESVVKHVAWNDSSRLNDFTTAGVYEITGERKMSREYDNLPIENSGGGHTISARLEVLDSSINETINSDDKCITQKLTLSNRVGGDGNVYIRTGRGRTYDSITWEKWGTLQTNINVGQVHSLDEFVDNGIYSGVWTDGSSFAQTFVMVVINDYAVAGDNKTIVQYKYAYDTLKGNGEPTYSTRSLHNGVWSNWEDTHDDDLIVLKEELLSRIQGRSENSDAAKDPFKFLGTFTSVTGGEFLNALNAMHGTKAYVYDGYWRALIGAAPVEIYNFPIYYNDDRWIQVLKSPYKWGDDDFDIINDTRYRTIYRICEKGVWGEWRDTEEELEKSISDESTRAEEAEKEIAGNLEALALDVVELLEDILNIKNQVARYDGNAFSASANEVKLTTTGVNTSNQQTVSLPTASTEKAGVMTSDDKRTLEEVSNRVDTDDNFSDFRADIDANATNIATLLDTKGNSIVDIGISPNELDVELELTSLDDTTTNISIPTATTNSAGVMSMEDKKTLDHTSELIGLCKLEQGGINGSNGKTQPGSNRLRTQFLAPPIRVELKEGFSFVLKAKYDSNYNFIEAIYAPTLNSTAVDNEHLYRFSIKKNDDSEILIADDPIASFSGGLQLSTFQQEERISGLEEFKDTTQTLLQEQTLSLSSVENSCSDNDIIVLEQGGINLSTGIVESNYALRCRTKNYFKAPLIYELNEGYQILGVIKYQLVDGEYSHVTTLFGTTFDIEYGDGYYYKFSVKRADGSSISVADDIFKVLLCGSQALAVENRISLINNENEINEHKSNITALQSEVAQMSDMFESTVLQGYKPVSYILSNLQKFSEGNVGLPVETRTSSSTVTYRLFPTYQNKYNYAVAAAVFTDVDNLSMVGDDATYPVSFLFNYNANIYAGSSNIITKGVVMVDNKTALVYQVSGRIAEKNNELPNTAYVRLAANCTQKFGVSKMLVLEVEDWNDNYVDILVGNIDNPTVWIDTDELKVIKKNVVLGRDLFSGIAFWGSSSTEGTWVKTVADSLNMPYYWGGSGGENIWAIMGRMGVLPLRIKDSFTIPASSNDAVALPENYKMYVNWKGNYKTATIWASQSVKQEKLLINPCYIAGVKGNLIGGGANSTTPLQFQRLEDGEAVTTKPYEPIYTFGFRETRDCVWFLACHFNGGQSSTEELVELYKKMYDTSCSKKVLILGRHKVANGAVTTPTLETLQEQEVALEDEFGLMFFNTREYMCGRGFERFKELYPTNYTTTDIEQASQGVTPDCMYESAANVHFNSKGYVVLTEAITQRLIELGYNLFRDGGDINHPKY